MTLLFVYLFFALGFSFLCSLLEAVLLSVTPSYAAHLVQEGSPTGARLHALKRDIDRPLAAILSLNTIAHTIGAAGVGAQAQLLWGSEALAATSAVLTLLILIFSEIIPKTFGARYWRALAPWTVRVLPAMVILLYPLVMLSNGITRKMRKSVHGDKVSREEVSALARLAAEQGTFDKNETRILRNLLRSSFLRAKDIMTPRTVVVSVPEATSIREIVDRAEIMRFSRIPVWKDREDHVTGYILKDEVLLNAARGQLSRRASELVRPLVVVPESLPVVRLFELLLERSEHIAFVVDEYGGMAGVVTMEDVVETLLGMEIVDEADAVEDMRALARRRWFSRAERLGLASTEALEAMQERLHENESAPERDR